MKTIWYYNLLRKKDRYLYNIGIPAILFLVLFVISLVVNKVFPDFNYQYMRWSDSVKKIIGVSSWVGSLYGNLWQLVSLFLPFYLVYTVMSNLIVDVIEDERLETIVFFQNIAVGRKKLLIGKTCLALAQSLLICFGLFLENVIFFLCLHAGQMITMSFRYFKGVFLISIPYIFIAVFMASYHRNEKECESNLYILLFYTFLLARISDAMNGFSAILLSSDREYVYADGMAKLAEKLQNIAIVCPAVWSWNAVSVNVFYVMAAVIISLIMAISGYLIYAGRVSYYEK